MLNSEDSLYCRQCQRRTLCRRSNLGAVLGWSLAGSYALFASMPILMFLVEWRPPPAHGPPDASGGPHWAEVVIGILLAAVPPTLFGGAGWIYQRQSEWRCSRCGGTKVRRDSPAA